MGKWALADVGQLLASERAGFVPMIVPQGHKMTVTAEDDSSVFKQGRRMDVPVESVPFYEKSESFLRNHSRLSFLLTSH